MSKTYNLNKKNIIFIIGLTITFGVFGWFLFTSPTTFVSGFVRSETFIKYFGLFSIIVAIPLLIGNLTLLKDSCGLKITEQGFVNNTNLTNVGMIYWKDVIKIERKSLKVNSVIFVYVKNEEDYYSQIKNPLKKLNILTYRHAYGASFVIEPKNLIGSLDEIELSLRNYIKT